MQPESQPPSQQPNQWQFVPEQNQQSNAQVPQQVPASNQAQISWSASEFVAYQKNSGWYIAAIFVVIAISATIYLLTKDRISSVTTLLIGILFTVFASRKPRVLNYEISDDGIRIGQKLYTFANIKSFAIIDEGSMHSISLLPLQRFMPALNMYFEPQDEQKIVETLGSYLPQEERKQELVDRIMHKIRF